MGTFTEELSFGNYKVGIWDEPPSFRTIIYQDFSPVSLFAAGEKGVWYDPSDLTTVWQDSARTTPGVVNSPVGCIDDKSGNGMNALQTTAGSRPILRQSGALYYLEFDGTDDFLATSAIDFSATDEMTLSVGIRKLSDAATFVAIENTTAAGSFRVFNLATAAGWTYGSIGTVSSDGPTPASYPAPITNVLTGLSKIATDQNLTRVNGAQVGNAPGDQGTGNYGNYPLYLGRRNGATLPFSGHIYQLVIRNLLTIGGDLANLETFVNVKTAAY